MGLEPQGTYTIRQFETIAGSTPLTPVTSSTTGTLYTSDSSRSTTNFGYTYPEIIDWDQTPSQLLATCTTYLNQLYNPNGWYFKKRKRNNIRRQLVPSTDDTSSNAVAIPVVLDSIAQDKPLRTWIVSIKVSKFDYSSPFVIRVFVGKPNLMHKTGTKMRTSLEASLFNLLLVMRLKSSDNKVEMLLFMMSSTLSVVCGQMGWTVRMSTRLKLS